jgi:sigma-E factor negative regulatory protein RseA
MTERLSALMDEELGRAEAEGCLAQLADDAAMREAWRVYHLIGDTLRGHAGYGLPPAFERRLDAEPTVLAPRRAVRSTRRVRYALSAAASAAAVALVGWMALPLFDAPVPLVKAPAPPAVATVAVVPPAPVPAAQGVNDYVLAHQRFSPSSAMGGMAPYVRTVSERREAR